MRGFKTAEKRGKKTLLFDCILVLSLLLVSLSVFLVVRLTRETGAYAEVTVDGEVVARYPLSENGEYVLNGGTNVLVIEDGRVRMKEATCPDRTCVSRHTGGVRYDGETITCLPNRVRIEIVGGGEG